MSVNKKQKKRRGRHNPDERMPIGVHLRELKRRIGRSALAIVLGSVAGWFVTDFILGLMRDPVIAMAVSSGNNSQLNYTYVTAAFDLKMQIAVVCGVVIASPVWIYQLFAFIVPALRKEERRYVLGFASASLPLFVLGCLSGWYVLPRIVGVMLGFASTKESTLIDATMYYQFVIKLVIVLGIAFIVPVVLVAMNFMGVLPAHAMRRGWRIAVLVIVVVTALVTPSADVFSMVILACPLLALYFSAVGIAWIHDRRLARRLKREGLAFDDA